MKTQKIVTALLAGMMLFNLAGCNNGNSGNGTSGNNTTTAKPVDTAKDREAHFVEGTLHKVNVTESNRVFTNNKSTEYQLVLGDNSLHLTAASFIYTHVRQATGASLKYAEEGAAWSADAKYIVLGDEEMFKAAGLTMPTDDIGNVGYYIKTAGNSVFIMSKKAEGYQLGSIAFLREVIGYDMLAADCVIYEKSGATLPDMNIIERPDYDVRIVSNVITSAGVYGMGYSEGRGVIDKEGIQFVHNSFDYLPEDTYNNEGKPETYHPDWYTDVLLVANGKEYRQLCYTAHNNQEEYELMQSTILDKMVKAINAAPDLSLITFTQQDVPYHCQCETCLDIVEEYGSYSAAIIMFVNELSDLLDVRLQEQADAEGTEKRDITIAFFAYHVSEAPPAKKNDKGEWEPINGIKCNDNVCVFVAPIYAKYNRSLYDDINVEYADNIRGWMSVSDKIMFWLYQTNYAQFLYPYNTWDSQIENYRFCKEAGGFYMFNEGQYDHVNTPAFAKLKEYIDSKALFDVNVDYNTLVDRFFKYYFREAEKPMRQFFEELQAHMCYLETKYDASLTGHIRDAIAKSEYWPQRTLAGWMELIDEAYAAIEKYKDTDSATYEMLSEHILIESIFPRYALCSLHSGSYSTDELFKMRQEFYYDCSALNITKVYEWANISGIFESWGVI